MISAANLFSIELGGRPTSARAPVVREATQGLTRIFAQRDHAEKAGVLSWAHVDALRSELLRRYKAGSTSSAAALDALQTLAWVFLGLFSASRGGELLRDNTRLADVARLSDGSFSFKLRHTKTQQHHVVKRIPYIPDAPRRCPARIFARYISELQLARPGSTTSLSLFPDLRPGARSTATRSVSSFIAATREALAAAVPDPIHFSGHSLRRSAATLLYEAGATDITLRAAGGWSSTEAAVGYIDFQPHLGADALARAATRAPRP